MKWALVAAIVACTVLSDLLQSYEMKRHGEIHFRRGGLPRIFAKLALRWPLVVAVLFLALSFFAFMKLLTVADLSFAVPATAATYVFETVLARFLLKEQISAKRWAGAGLVACGVALLAL